MELVAVRLGTNCSECMGPVPINRIAEQLVCQHCLSTFPVEWEDDLFACFRSMHPRGWLVGERRRGTRVDLDVKFEVERVEAPPEGASSRAADALTQRIFPDATIVFGEMSSIDPTANPTQALVTACMQCGAGLKVDGTSRVVECRYCNESNFLSDALWLRMHPALKRRWLVLGYA
jgi:DNA-directed RNA polymerase subunit RPC12/RpoP